MYNLTTCEDPESLNVPRQMFKGQQFVNSVNPVTVSSRESIGDGPDRNRAWQCVRVEKRSADAVALRTQGLA